MSKNLTNEEVFDLRNAIIAFGGIIIEQVNESRDYSHRKIRTVHMSNWEINDAVEIIIDLADKYAKKEENLNTEDIVTALQEPHPYAAGSYAIVELYGRRVRYGFVTDVEDFGTHWVRISGCKGELVGFGRYAECEDTEQYAPSAVFSITPISREKYDELTAQPQEAPIVDPPPAPVAQISPWDGDDQFGDF